MLITLKDLKKLLPLAIVSFCAVFVSYLFLNFQMDLLSIKDEVATTPLENLYEAKLTIGKVVVGMSSGSLSLVAIVMLFFYTKRFVDSHRHELGILKALGYSNWEISRQFVVFGLTIFIGCLSAVIGAQLVIAHFYEIQRDALPSFSPSLHPFLVLILIILPTIFFSLLAILYTQFQLKIETILLLKNQATPSKIKQKILKTSSCFLKDLKRTSFRSHKILIFFIWFAGFTFSTMLNLSFGMTDLADEWISYMMLTIGLILSYTILNIALSTVVSGQSKTISMLKVFGYSQKEIQTHLLDVYRPVAYFGFLLGLVYQYGLMNILFYVLNQGNPLKLDYPMNWKLALYLFALFCISYELFLYLWKRRMASVPLKLVQTAE